MRGTAQQIVKDVDEARAELKRAILYLPEETRTNADAMRQVVADQINALSALAEVVRSQSSGLDLSGPGVQIAHSPSPRENGNGNGAGKSEGATSIAAKAKAAVADQMEAEPIVVRDIPRLEFPPISRPGAAPAGKGEQRTLGKDMERLVNKLNAAARDLSEAIDGKLQDDLERKYSGGDRGVYTHQLFTVVGRKLEKLIASRYESERMMRGRVDNYVRLFERLLDIASNGPNGEQLVESCLASEAGKLYIMLAQASGRIPNE
jgi:hypothetical protein